MDPVEVGGVTVSRASLHNPSLIADLGVDAGDRVRIKRAGDVIPDVVEVLDDDGDGHFEFPETCPACDSPVARDGPMATYAVSLTCPAQRERSVEHYASRDALDIEGLGEKAVQQLLDADLVSDPADLYELTVEDLTDLEGWGETSSRNLVEGMEDAREPPLADFLVALGIPEVGTVTARNLAQEFGTFESILAAADDGDTNAFESVPDVGPTVARSIVEFFEGEGNRAVIDRLLDHVDPQAAEETGGNALDGQTFVFTGSLDGYTRSDAQELIERNGGSATSSVSGNTDYLVLGDNPGQRKQDDAAENDVETLSEAEFEALLEDADVL